MSAAAGLAQRTLDRVVSETDATEVIGTDGGAYLTLTSPMSEDPVGSMRVFAGGLAAKTVYVGMTVAPIGLDSHMIFAFADAESPVPHFTLDSVEAGDMHAFHLDLVPRCDLGVSPDCLAAAYAPLEDSWESATQIDGLTPAHLSRSQWAIMSPWMLANRATAEALTAIEPTVVAYLDHWLGLLRGNLQPELCGSTGAELAARDHKHRATLFSPEVDPVWAQVDQLVGATTSRSIQEMLRTNELPGAP